MDPRHLCLVLAIVVGCADPPADTQPLGETDEPVLGDLTGFGIFEVDYEGQIETYRFDLGPPTVDDCFGCDVVASVVDSEVDLGEHIGWDADQESLFVDIGGGDWQLFRSPGVLAEAGGTWSATSDDGSVDITADWPAPGFDWCDPPEGSALSSAPDVSDTASGQIDCDTANIDLYTIPLRAGETVDLHLTAVPGNDPYLLLGDQECLLDIFDDGLPCGQGDSDRLCSAVTYTASEDMDLEVLVEWYSCLPGGMAYELGIGGDVTSLPEPESIPLPQRYLEPGALSYVETIELRWLYE